MYRVSSSKLYFYFIKYLFVPLIFVERNRLAQINKYLVNLVNIYGSKQTLLGQLGQKRHTNTLDAHTHSTHTSCYISVLQFHFELELCGQFVVDEGRNTCYEEDTKKQTKR